VLLNLLVLTICLSLIKISNLQKLGWQSAWEIKLINSENIHLSRAIHLAAELLVFRACPGVASGARISVTEVRIIICSSSCNSTPSVQLPLERNYKRLVTVPTVEILPLYCLLSLAFYSGKHVSVGVDELVQKI